MTDDRPEFDGQRIVGRDVGTDKRSVFQRLTDWALGEKIGASETRHAPAWFPSTDFDWRALNERVALMRLPPYKPPYCRHCCMKAWVDMGPLHRVSIVEWDLDERTVDVDIYR